MGLDSQQFDFPLNPPLQKELLPGTALSEDSYQKLHNGAPRGSRGRGKMDKCPGARIPKREKCGCSKISRCRIKPGAGKGLKASLLGEAEGGKVING